MKCGHKWKASALLAPGAPREIVAGNMRIPVRGDRVYVEQECVEPEGHDGPHRSLTHERDEGQRVSGQEARSAARASDDSFVGSNYSSDKTAAFRSYFYDPTTEPRGAWAKPLAARKLHFFRDGHLHALCGGYMTSQVKPSEFGEGALIADEAERCPKCELKFGYFVGFDHG